MDWPPTLIASHTKGSVYQGWKEGDGEVNTRVDIPTLLDNYIIEHQKK